MKNLTSCAKVSDGRPSELLREKHYYNFHDNKLNFVGSAEQLKTSRPHGETRLTAEGQEKATRFPQKGLVQIGNRIRDLRFKKHIPQIELARILQITPSALSQIENNQSFPSLPLFIDIARYFDKSLDSLLVGTSTLNKASRTKQKRG